MVRDQRDTSPQISSLNTVLAEVMAALGGDRIDIPYIAAQLDLSQRKGDTGRQAKYIHQHCYLHAHALTSAVLLKLEQVVRGFIEAHSSVNPVGQFLYARALVELAAFVFHVKHSLHHASQKSQQDWQGAGLEFFSILVRARFGTSDPELAQSLSKMSVSGPNQKPFNITNCLKVLREDEAGRRIEALYPSLCDGVHHNVTSQFLTTNNTRESNKISVNGRSIILGDEKPVLIFEHSIRPQNTVDAISEKYGENLAFTARCILKWSNQIPCSPYSSEFLEKTTGSANGVRHVKSGSSPARNSICTCGSGKKYKHCCLLKMVSLRERYR